MVDRLQLVGLFHSCFGQDRFRSPSQMSQLYMSSLRCPLLIEKIPFQLFCLEIAPQLINFGQVVFYLFHHKEISFTICSEKQPRVVQPGLT